MVLLLEQRLEVEPPDRTRPTWLEPMVWEGQGTFAQADDGQPLLGGSLLVTDDQGRRLASLPVAFTSRIRAANDTTLLGSDRSGSLRVALEASTPGGPVRMHFRFEPSSTVTPAELLPVTTWLVSLDAGRMLGLWMDEKHRWGVGPQAIPPDQPRIPEGYVSMVRLFARVQERSGSTFNMPPVLDDRDMRTIEAADKLIRGETVRGRWQQISINDDPQLFHYVESSPHGVRLEFKAEYSIEFDDGHVVLGEAEYRFMQATLRGRDSEAGIIRLVPGPDNRFEIRLLSVAERVNADGTTAWVPSPMLEPYEGRWVAQTGTKIILSGDSFEEVAAGARARGQLTTVWRVPGSPAEADRHPSIGL